MREGQEENFFSKEELNFLLERDLISIQWDPQIEKWLKKKTILITGAGGSIGSYLIEKILFYGPEKVIALDVSEKALFDLRAKALFKIGQDSPLIYVLADIRSNKKIRELFNTYRPQIVFHIAAYKHLLFTQDNLYELIRNNTLATMDLADLSVEYQVEDFIFTSTFKAVNPSSQLGISRRLAELYMIYKNKIHKSIRFSTIRFGDVFLSSNSFIYVLLNQIKNKQTISITNNEAKRYFLTLREVSYLILKAISDKSSEGLYMIKIGEEIKISELAKRLIRVILESEEEYTPGFTIVGLLPGEKIKEDIHYEYEKFKLSTHPNILKSAQSYPSYQAQKDKVVFKELISSNKHLQASSHLNEFIDSL